MNQNRSISPSNTSVISTNPSNPGMTIAALLFTSAILTTLAIGATVANYSAARTCKHLPTDPRQATTSQLETRFGVDAGDEISLAENAQEARIRVANATRRGFDKCSK